MRSWGFFTLGRLQAARSKRLVPSVCGLVFYLSIGEGGVVVRSPSLTPQRELQWNAALEAGFTSGRRLVRHLW